MTILNKLKMIFCYIKLVLSPSNGIAEYGEDVRLAVQNLYWSLASSVKLDHEEAKLPAHFNFFYNDKIITSIHIRFEYHGEV